MRKLSGDPECKNGTCPTLDVAVYGDDMRALVESIRDEFLPRQERT